MKPRLSIVIPSYNREKYIGELLDSIVKGSKLLKFNELEVVISDNASTDRTATIARSYASMLNINVHVNNVNVGADRNYLNVVELATGEYCWLMGSDDTITDTSIQTILASIKDHPDIVIFDRTECDIDMNPMANRSWMINPVNAIYECNGSEWSSYFKTLASLGGVFSFLGSIVFKKSRWDDITFDDSYIGTAYSHSYILMKMLSEGAKLKINSFIAVNCRIGNDSFLTDGMYRRYMLDFNGYEKLANDVFKGTSASIELMHILSREYGTVRKRTTLFYFISKEIGIVSCVKLMIRFGFSWREIFIAMVLGKLYPIYWFIKYRHAV